MILFGERILDFLRNKKNVAIAMVALCISLISSGVLTFVYCHYFGKQQFVLLGEQRAGDNAIEWSSDGNSFSTLSDDGYMWFDFDDPVDIEHLVINFKNHSLKPWRLQIYYATPEMGFNQDASVLQNIPSGEEKASLNLAAKNVNSFRIDWGDDAGRVYSLDSVQINMVDKFTQFKIFLLLFLTMLALGLVYLMFDTELGFAINIAVKRLAIRNLIADLLFGIMSFYHMFWERGGDYILFCNLLLCHTCVNVVTYFYTRLIRGNIVHPSCSRIRLFIEKTSLVVIVAAIGFLFLKNTDSAVLGIGDNYEIIDVIIGIALFIFSINYGIIENRLIANGLVLAITTALINFYINKAGNFYAYYVITFYMISVLVYKMPEKRVVKCVLFVIAFFTFLTYFLSVTNIYGNTVAVASDTMKRTLGFLNPNDTSFHFLMLTILFLYFNNGVGRIRLFENFIVAVIGLGAIIYSGGRTSIIGVAYELVIITGFIIYSFIPVGMKKKLNRINVLSVIFAQGVLLISCLGSIYWSLIYEENKRYYLFSLIEHVFDPKTFGQRLQKANNLLNQYKPLMFGRYIPYILDGKDLYVEIFYVNALLRNGIILLVFYMLLASIMNIRLWKRQQYFRLLLLVIIPVVTLGESFADNPVYNVFTFLALSCLESREESEAVGKGDNYKRPIIFLALALVWAICFPAIVAYFTTLFEYFNIEGWAAGFIAAAAVISGCIFTKTIYNTSVEYFDSKVISVTGKAKLLVSTVVLMALISAGGIMVSNIAEQNADNLSNELPVLQLVSDNSKGMIYADRLPMLYKGEVSGVKYSYRHINDLQYKKNVTLISDSADDKSDFFAKGFLYMPISDKTAIYTNDSEIVRLLQNNGYLLFGYHNYSNCVDLQYEAELNDVELNEEGKMVLKGEKDSLDKGPFISLSSGKYTVSFELHIDELPIDNDVEVALASVSSSWGQNELGKTVVTAGMFDTNGDYKCDVQVNGGGSGYEFRVAPLCDACLQVGSIKYVRTPDYDTHILVDNKWRKIHEEYYDLDGKPFEYSGGYYGISFEYDEEGNINAKTYLDKDMNPVITNSGYASVKSEYNDKGKVIRDSYFDTEDNPIALSKGQASVEYEYDEAGNRIVERYYDTEGNPVLYNDQYFYTRRTYDDKKQIILEEYFDIDESPALLSDGAYGYRREYDDLGNVITTVYLGADGNPVQNTSGYAILRRSFDSKKQIVREEYYDSSDQPIALSRGQAAVEYEYDEVGNRTAYSYYDVSNAPVLYNGQYWRLEVTYNELKQNIMEKYFDIDGSPAVLADGASGYSREYDEVGNATTLTYLDDRYQATTNINGYSRWRRQFNKEKQVIRESYYDTHDVPVALAGGQGAVEYEYDEAGNRIIDRYYGLKDNPILYYGEYWYLVRTYNDKKQNIHEEYFDLDGKLFMRPSVGYCSVDIKYDESGVVAGRIYYDLDGNVVKEE